MPCSTRPENAHLLRPLQERIAQTLLFELGGLALVLPAYSAITGHGTGESAALMAMLALGCLLAGPLHNAVYDRIDLRRTGRTACQRGPRARLAHAISHELALTAVGIPILMGLGGHGLWDTLALNAMLTLAYTAWAAVFYLAWDRARPIAGSAPITPPGSSRAPSAP
ncbi:chlorhexidine efflux transporter [Meridianimarinicoccus sp. RP-17]|uniref:chlorhexidine efflux transporter n=1 Tax=Meridianimarinicoccus zhengii TaxID=2056810 RepID=UPI000DABF4A5|nr:chlorhexidine efflux transporter [Phycocomes zhengii]